jgi:hypothetical protein
MKTWKIVEVGEGFDPDDELPLDCDRCGTEAVVPYRKDPGNPVIAITGMTIFTDNPGKKAPFRTLPRKIQCRYCRMVYVLDNHEPEGTKAA